MTQQIRIVSTTSAAEARRSSGLQPGSIPVERLIRAGQRLFHQGDSADHLLEVRAGVLRQTRVLESGDRQVIGFHFAGDFVGFSSDGVHRADCTAITDGRAIIHRVDVFASASSDRSLQDRMRRAVLRQMTLAQDQLVMLGRRSAGAKVRAFVQHLAERIGTVQDGKIHIDIPMSRYDIADFLGVAVETISRSFTELRNAGVISLENPHRMTILRPSELASVH